MDVALILKVGETSGADESKVRSTSQILREL